MRSKDVINVADGRKLGYISDIEIDLEIGKVTAIIVPGPRGAGLFFGKPTEWVIPWEKIRKIGPDAIIVELAPTLSL